MNFFKRPFVYAVIFTLLLLATTSYVLLDTFVIEHKIQSVENTKDTQKTDNMQSADISQTSEIQNAGTAQDSETSQYSGTQSTGTAQDSETSQNSDTPNAGTSHQAEITENAYIDENISITIQTLREYDTTIYAADITLSDPALLKTAMADDSFGTNVTEKTSSMASRVNAILAVNGDYYGANNKGYVIKNGILYRDTVRSDNQYADLALWADGSLSFINEADISAQPWASSMTDIMFLWCLTEGPPKAWGYLCLSWPVSWKHLAVKWPTTWTAAAPPPCISMVRSSISRPPVEEKYQKER